MSENRIIQELRGALCALLSACKSADTYGLDQKAVDRAVRMLSVTRKRKQAKARARQATETERQLKEME